MATYYKWRRSTVKYVENGPAGYAPSYVVGNVSSSANQINYTTIYYSGTEPAHQFNEQTGEYSFQYANTYYVQRGGQVSLGTEAALILEDFKQQLIYYRGETYGIHLAFDSTGQIRVYTDSSSPYRIYVKNARAEADTSQGYVYSTNSSAYPNGGVSGSYYYDQRTTVTSPTAASGLTYPATITTSSVNISWTAATSNVPNYTVNQYEVSYSTNGGSGWTVAGTTAETSYSFDIPAGTTSILFRVRAKDSNNQYGAYVTGTASQVLLSPTLTVPQMVMQGQSTTISWSAVEGADSYTLQRKSSADADWTQVYSGANLSYTETVGTWTSLQYRVQGVFDGTPGGWVTSGDIQIVAASALVISGTDGDLGTLTSDVQYSISSDQTSPTIDVAVEVNGGEYASFQATSGQTYKVGVLDLPTGTGSIVITATTTVSSSPVSVTRTWTYSKTATSFPSAGNVGQLTQEGAVVWPETLAEAVRAGTPWGGNLSTALELLKKAALYNRTQTPKYNEVTIDLSTLTQTDAQNGKIINLPYNGVMIPHRVVHIGNPDPELYDASCDGVWLLRDGMLEEGQWKGNPTSGDVPLSNSNIISNMEEDADNYDISVKNQIKQVKIPWSTLTTLYTQSNGLSVKLFPLSSIEVGAGTSHPGLVDSATLDYFSENSQENRAINLYYWLRTPYILDSANVLNVCLITPTGVMGNTAVNYTHYYRPCLILPTTFSATYYVDQNGNLQDQQEYTPAGDWLDVWGNVIPAVRIETGSYTGTGTYGQSNPNTLTFSFQPKVVFIENKTQTTITAIWTTAPLINGTVMAHCYGRSGNTGVTGYLWLTWEGNTLKYYSETNTQQQMNDANQEYNYIALG